MRKTSVALLAGSVGIGSTLAVSAALSQGGQTVPPAPAASPPAAQDRSLTGDRRMDAIVFGLASVAVDSEAAVIRINELEDRIAQLERRLKELEARADPR